MNTAPPSPQSTPSDYLVGVTIGEIAFGNVIFGRHKATNREVAIKVIPKLVFDKQPFLIECIMQERLILTKCNASPHVISLYASFHDEQCLYLVMECATRGTLMDTIIQSSNSNSDEWRMQVVPYYTSQLIQALEYLHDEQHIIHADLKPVNILVSESGKLKLCDFGSALDMSTTDFDEGGCGNDQERTAVTRRDSPFMPRGTADYAAPELVRSSGDISPAVDLWSLGCVVFCMLHSTKQSPFHAESDALCIDKIIKYIDRSNGGDASDFLGGIPDEWMDLVGQLLDSDPRKRGNVRSLQSQYEILQSASMHPPLIPPRPAWCNGAHSTPMRDGSQGWAAFLVD